MLHGLLSSRDHGEHSNTPQTHPTHRWNLSRSTPVEISPSANVHSHAGRPAALLLHHAARVRVSIRHLNPGRPAVVRDQPSRSSHLRCDHRLELFPELLPSLSDVEIVPQGILPVVSLFDLHSIQTRPTPGQSKGDRAHHAEGRQITGNDHATDRLAVQRTVNLDRESMLSRSVCVCVCSFIRQIKWITVCCFLDGKEAVSDWLGR